ncbi:MAG: sugar phosphate isomerase/epimerase [Chloroflexi bacterium]|nr:sugar phosphate isomerase/epimerase [Chloroflexota bacterium]
MYEKISGFSDEIIDDFTAQLDAMQALGIKYVEVRNLAVNGQPKAVIVDLTADDLRVAKQELDSRGMHVSAIGSPIGKIMITDDFDSHLERFKGALRAADILETSYIRMFSFFMPEGEDPAQHRDEVMRRLKALCDAARHHRSDILLLHENESDIYGDTPARCQDIFESVGAENLRLTLDPANFVACDVKPFTEAYPALKPWLHYVHVKDKESSDGKVVVAGEGRAEWRELLGALKADGYAGFFSLEPHLQVAGRSFGYTGHDLFAKAHAALMNLLTETGWQAASPANAS